MALLLSVPGVAVAQSAATVPIRRLQDNSIELVHFFAAQASKDALVLVLYGNDENLTQTGLRAAGQARAAGYPLRGVVLGPVRDDAPYVIEFYADAQLIATYLNPTVDDEAAILAQLRRGYVEIVLPRRERQQ